MNPNLAHPRSILTQPYKITLLTLSILLQLNKMRKSILHNQDKYIYLLEVSSLT